MSHKEPVNLTDEEYMIEFYESHKSYLLFIAGKFAHSQVDREDIVQETLLKLMNKVQTLRQLNKKQIATYLFLTVRSVYADRMKSTQERTVPISDALLEKAHLENQNGLYEEQYDAKWDVNILKAGLSEKEWTLLESKYILGYNDHEIARNLGYASDSIRTLIRRARNHARTILRGKHHESEVE